MSIYFCLHSSAKLERTTTNFVLNLAPPYTFSIQFSQKGLHFVQRHIHLLSVNERALDENERCNSVWLWLCNVYNHFRFHLKIKYGTAYATWFYSYVISIIYTYKRTLHYMTTHMTYTQNTKYKSMHLSTNWFD